ncbi:hypothetical protein ACFFJH_07020 [Undibacterium danionis]|uniref:Uncharacterized protein n=1 Tax=Undibacterium danionis TaxID=1812100 RepID=A0ABV6ID79_9BURK
MHAACTSSGIAISGGSGGLGGAGGSVNPANAGNGGGGGGDGGLGIAGKAGGGGGLIQALRVDCSSQTIVTTLPDLSLNSILILFCAIVKPVAPSAANNKTAMIGFMMSPRWLK